MTIGLQDLTTPQTEPGFASSGKLVWPDWRAWSAAAAKALTANVAAEESRWFAWSVVAFGAGILAYFGLKAEPSWWLAGALVGVGAIAAGLRWRAPPVLRFLCVLFCMAALGFACAKFRTALMDAPRIERDRGPLWISGRIESVAPRNSGRVRIVIAPAKMGNDTENLPRRLRLSLSAKAAASVAPGADVSVLAMLRPNPEPVQPYDYDFARYAFFEGIGGVGFGLGSAKPLDEASSPSLSQRLGARIDQLRIAMSARIMAAIPGPNGAIAAALITGEDGAVTDEDTDAYRDSGLAHVLSISGTHMALVGFGLFWVIRALLALWPYVALRYPIKKWAAAVAIAGAGFYLAISGASPPAMRSFIMLAAMLMGVLFDRPALSMRGVSLAALGILIFAPESVISAGFEMSFAAVVGLIALAEWQAGRVRDDIPAAGWFAYLWRKARAYVLGILLTSLVAGLATAPFAIYHFDRAAGYSLVSNMAALPVVGFIIMPAAALGVLLMPFGLEAGPLHAMGWGVGVMTGIANKVAALPGAATLAPAWPASALVAIVFGGLWIALWQRRWRWLGFAPIAAGLVLALLATRPDVLVARDGATLGIRGANGELAVIGKKPDEYTIEQWLKRDGDSREPAMAIVQASCDELGCTVQTASGKTVALSLHMASLADDCARADVLVAAVPVRMKCEHPALVLDRFATAKNGATALWLEGDQIRMETVAEARGDRPWTQYLRNNPTSVP